MLLGIMFPALFCKKIAQGGGVYNSTSHNISFATLRPYCATCKHVAQSCPRLLFVFTLLKITIVTPEFSAKASADKAIRMSPMRAEQNPTRT